MDNPIQSNTFTPDDDVTAIIRMFGAHLADATKPFTLIVRLKMKAGTQHAVDAAFAQAKRPTMLEAGVISFDLNRDVANPNSVVVYERWRSLRDLEVHLRTPYATTLRRAFDQTGDGHPEFSILTPVAA